jgi:hypothetical protein
MTPNPINTCSRTPKSPTAGVKMIKNYLRGIHMHLKPKNQEEKLVSREVITVSQKYLSVSVGFEL